MGGRISFPIRGVMVQRCRGRTYVNNDALLIGLAGQKRVGKDTFADALDRAFYERGRRPMHTAFAEGVKMSLSQHFGVPRQFIEHWKDMDTTPPHFNMNIRSALQLIGEQMRKIQGDVWVNHLYNELRGDAVITDVRHENEIEAVRNWGGKLVLIVRDTPNDDDHISEATLKESSMWCIDHIKPTTPGGLVNMSSVQIPPDAPSLLHQFDYIVFNDATITSLDKTASALFEQIVEARTEYDSDEIGSLNI